MENDHTDGPLAVNFNGPAVTLHLHHHHPPPPLAITHHCHPPPPLQKKIVGHKERFLTK